MHRAKRRLMSPAFVVKALVVTALLPGCARAQESDTEASPARSVILFIGDGVDDHQLTIGRNYLHGAAGTLLFEGLAHRATARVLTVQEDDPSVPEYVADSASGGTALSAGVVTSRGRIATTAGSDEDIATIVEMAKEAGKKTGVVATSSITDATPASFYAHVRFRFCEGPEDMDGGRSPPCPEDKVENGGPGSIGEQLATSKVDVALGGGLETFEQATHRGPTVLDLAKQNGFQIVTTKEELEAAETGRLLGLFANGHLPVRWQGEGRGRALPLKARDDGQRPEAPRFGCEPSPSFEGTPDLATLTRRAIELLSTSEGEGEGDAAENQGEGFFLMVESASIDKQAHAASPCGQIGEIQQLEEAVQAALDYAATHPDTLILVASDHGHAGQVIPYPSLFDALGMAGGRPIYSPGKFAVVETPEGGVMGVNYATNNGFAEEHTGSAIPIFGQGPGAERLQGLIDQTEVFEIMKTAFGF